MQRYYSLSSYLKRRYGKKVYKLPIDGGFSCPNRERHTACIFCSEHGSGEFTLSGSVEEQIVHQKERLQHKKAEAFIAYFQSFTNTYAPLAVLQQKYESLLQDDSIEVVDIATRADCLDDEIIDYLDTFNRKKEIWIEIGLQTTNDRVAKKIRRGYPTQQFYDVLEKLSARRIKTVAHIICGLPSESEESFLRTVTDLNGRSLFGIKIHSLYIQKDAPLFKWYQQQPFPLLTKERYTDLVVCALERLEESVVIHRLTGDADKRLLFEPLWCADKLSVIGEIQKKLKDKNTYQGKRKRRKETHENSYGTGCRFDNSQISNIR